MDENLMVRDKKYGIYHFPVPKLRNWLKFSDDYLSLSKDEKDAEFVEQ